MLDLSNFLIVCVSRCPPHLRYRKSEIYEFLIPGPPTPKDHKLGQSDYLVSNIPNSNSSIIALNLVPSWGWNSIPVTLGIFSGFVEVCLMHPLDVIKTRFQIQRGPDDPTRYTSLADCFRKMYRAEG